MNNKYIGHPSQLCGVRETKMIGGKADGMRLLEVRNGIGLDFIVSLDRCADISYLYYNNNSMAYIAPCGMVGPQYYDNQGAGFLKSFTAGFITTCGLTAVGSPCVDNNETLPLHGNISHIPCEQYSYQVTDEYIKIFAKVRDASIFGHQLVLNREYTVSLNENLLTVCDTVENIGCKETPYMFMYHCNMGYPLISENAKLDISSNDVVPRGAHAAKDLERWNELFPPSSDFVEQCYYHSFDKDPSISIKNYDIATQMQMTFDITTLDCFTQWKMMGENEYVLGLEPGNCHPDGRDVMREKGILKFLKPSESVSHKIEFRFLKLI